MSYEVMFNCANAIARMPKKRRDWEQQLVDDFIRRLHRRQYHCANRNELMRRLKFIAGDGGNDISWQDNENHVKLDNPAYGEKTIPARMYGFALGYVDLDERIKPLELGASFIFIKFNDFYDIRQRQRFGGCYVEVIPI